jgi:hypothetical protein
MTISPEIRSSKKSKTPHDEEDVKPNGDAKSGAGEDNHKSKGNEESAEDFIIQGDENDRSKKD